MSYEELISIFSVFLTIFIGSGSIFSYIIQNRMVKIQNLEEKVRDERRKLYADFIDPFVQLFSKGESQERAMEIIQSPEFKRLIFDLTLLGSDGFVKTYGELMQFFYKNQNYQGNSEDAVVIFGKMLLEIRKDLTPTTSLSSFDMLRFLITDINRIESKFK